MLVKINKFSQEGCLILNINIFSLCSTRHFANYFVLNMSHKYDITNLGIIERTYMRAYSSLPITRVEHEGCNVNHKDYCINAFLYL